MSSPAQPVLDSRRLRRGAGDARAFRLASGAAGMVILLIAGLLLYRLYVDSAQSRRTFGWHFLVSTAWDPVRGEFGALPFVYGTAVSSAVALFLAIPLGIGAAIFLAEMAPTRISSVLAFLVELLAAIPSVIYGLTGILMLVPLHREVIQPFLGSNLGFLPLFRPPISGVSLLAAGTVLAIMIVPFIISVSREALLAVPREQREASFAVGATRWETTWQVVVPHARLGIVSSVFLSLARALGETMAVTMVIGNDPRISASLFSSGYSIAAVIANEFMEAGTDLHAHALTELALVLFLISVLFNGLARLMLPLAPREVSR